MQTKPKASFPKKLTKPDKTYDCPECLCDKQKNPLTWREAGEFCLYIYPMINRVDWWRCKACKTKFITVDLGEPDIPIPEFS